MYRQLIISIAILLFTTTIGSSQINLQKELSTNGRVSHLGIVGKQAPELKVKQWVDAEGKVTEPVQLADYKGKFIVLYGFQAWCPGCHSKGLPALKRMSDELKDNANVAFIAIQTVFEGAHANTYERMVEIKDQYGINIPFGHDHDPEGTSRISSSTMNNYRSGGTPWYILIDQEGLVVFNDFHLDVDKTIDYLKTINANQ